MYWKRKKRPLPRVTERSKFPVGTFLNSPKGYFYVAGEDRLLRLISKRVLDSWSPHRTVEVSEEAILGYRITAKLKFRNGSLIHSLADGKIYLIVEGKRRHIQNPDALTLVGASIEDVVSVSLNELKLHELGEPLI